MRSVPVPVRTYETVDPQEGNIIETLHEHIFTSWRAFLRKITIYIRQGGLINEHKPESFKINDRRCAAVVDQYLIPGLEMATPVDREVFAAVSNNTKIIGLPMICLIKDIS